MQNPNFPAPVYPPVSVARMNAIAAAVTAALAAAPAKSDFQDSEIIALAPEFAATPGTLKAIKDKLGLT